MAILHARPRLWILLAAVAATVASTYPVVFFGRSFVSPANGPVQMLYPDAPYVPGFPGQGVEDMRGADVGAFMWQHRPYANLQHRAIFHDHEWPLWNRYSYAGLPLLGQGASMIGDPLDWMPILTDGAAWAWDLKFLLAKLLFAWGVGLLVFAATRHLPAALVLACSGVFIGFFAFRGSHPEFFSFCYAPWMLLAWVEMLRSRTLPRRCAWALVLILSSLMVLNSGAIKEGAVAIFMMHFAGALAFLLWPGAPREKARLLAFLVGVEATLVLVSAPFWLTFLDTLRASATVSDALGVGQLPAAHLFAFIENAFWGPRSNNSSLNLLVYLAIGLALLRPAPHWRNPVFLASALTFFLSLGVAYAFIPDGLLIHVPFIRNIGHAFTAFGDTALLSGFVVAGFGVRSFFQTASDRRWTWTLWLLFGLTVLLGFVFYHRLYVTQHLEKLKYMPVLPLYWASFLALPFLVRRMLIRKRAGALGALALALCLLVIHVRHGMHLETGGTFDLFVFNPQPRPDFSAPSPAVEALRAAMDSPARVQGVNQVLFPGTQVSLGLESLNSPDPLWDPHFKALAQALGFDYEWFWRIQLGSGDVARLAGALDFLNVRYLLYPPGVPVAPGLRVLASQDLVLAERPSAWPRAFYAPAVFRYDTVPDLARRIAEAQGQPFAALQKSDAQAATALAGLPEPAAGDAALAATEYRLTANSTAFTLDAPAPGVAVLGEAYYPESFRVTVNGQPAPYFRVNEDFKGVFLPGAGRYRLVFTYRPRTWSLALGLGAVGLLGVLALALGAGLIVLSGRKA